MSNHNYAFKDFKMSKSEAQFIMLDDIVIPLYLKKIKNIPDRIVKRVERMMNDALSEYEEKIRQDIPLDKVNFEVCLEIDTNKDTFAMWLYMGCEITDDGVEKTEYLTPDDADYQFIKEFFAVELNKQVADQVEQIMSHID
jgi:hypothetical protein